MKRSFEILAINNMVQVTHYATRFYFLAKIIYFLFCKKYKNYSVVLRVSTYSKHNNESNTLTLKFKNPKN